MIAKILVFALLAAQTLAETSSCWASKNLQTGDTCEKDYECVSSCCSDTFKCAADATGCPEQEQCPEQATEEKKVNVVAIVVPIVVVLCCCCCVLLLAIGLGVYGYQRSKKTVEIKTEEHKVQEKADQTQRKLNQDTEKIQEF